MDDDQTLVERWSRAIGAIVSPSTSAERVEAVGRRLLTAWDEPHRAYHSRAHLAETLQALDLLSGTPGPLTVATARGAPTTDTLGPVPRPTAQELSDGHPPTDASRGHAVTGPGPAHASRMDQAFGELALWFHDAIYDPRAAAGENEERSAGLAARELSALGVVDSLAHRVRDLIAMTAEHDATADPISPAVHDADLWILAAPAERFDAYCGQVRREYAHVPAADYALGRSRILTALADRDGGLYRTPTGRARWEAPAQANVRRELARLTPAPPPHLP